MVDPSAPGAPWIVPLDSGGKQYEWHGREFEVEITFNRAGVCDGVFVVHRESGYELEWDDVEGLTLRDTGDE
jgi:hypothetical protein